MRIMTLLGVIAFLAFPALADDKKWWVMRASCSNCDVAGNSADVGERNWAGLRLFITNPVYAEEYDYECLGGAFYGAAGFHSSHEFEYDSESEADSATAEEVRHYKRDGYEIHRVSLPTYCD